jgi:hypothetical protein
LTQNPGQIKFFTITVRSYGSCNPKISTAIHPVEKNRTATYPVENSRGALLIPKQRECGKEEGEEDEEGGGEEDEEEEEVCHV